MSKDIFPCEYKASIYNEIEHKEEYVCGITFANNFTEAMSNIESYYEDELIDVQLFMCEAGVVYEFNSDAYGGILNIPEIIAITNKEV